MNYSINSRKKSSYIFVFGNTGVGKSTIIASLIRAIHDSDNLVLRTNIKDKDSTKYMSQKMLFKILKNDFPDITKRGEIIEIDVGFEVEGTPHKLGLTFLEMSGEDLRTVDFTRYDDEAELDFALRFKDCLERSDLLLLVTSVDEATNDDWLMQLFLETTNSLRVKVPTFLIISMWDKARPTDNVDEFVSKNLALSKKFLKNKVLDSRISSFTVGRVVFDENTHEPRIQNFDNSDAEKLLGAMFTALKANKRRNISR